MSKRAAPIPKRREPNGRLWTNADRALCATLEREATAFLAAAEDAGVLPVERDQLDRPSYRPIGTPDHNKSERTIPFLNYALADIETDESAADATGRRYLTVTLADGSTVDPWEVEAALVPSVDFVTQGATTKHRDRRAFSGQTRTRVVLRKACPEGCTKVSPITGKVHRHTTESRLYVRTLAPYGEDGAARSEAIRDAQGRLQARTVSPRQGRRAKRQSIGSWAMVTYRTQRPMDTRDGYVVVEPHSPMIREDGTLVPAHPGNPVWRSGQYVDLPWQRPVFVPAVVRGDKVGRPQAETLTASRRSLGRRIAESREGQSLVAAILAACEGAMVNGGRPVAAAAGVYVTADQDGLTVVRRRGGESTTLAVGSFRGRKATARLAAAVLIGS